MPKTRTSKSTRQSPTEKPYPEFPLTAHKGSGQWCKKVKGKLHYFGPIGKPEAALTKWEAERDYLLTGRTPPVNLQGVLVRDLLNGFLIFKKARVGTGELSQGMFAEYRRMTDAILATFGEGRLVSDLDASDFARLREYLSKGRKLVALANAVRKCRVVFRWGHESGLLENPARMGHSFEMPNKASLRKERAKRGRMDFTAQEFGAMVESAGVPMKAFVLLGLNCALGSGDIGKMPLSALDLQAGWLDYPRPKTGVARRCALWPETVKACKAAIDARPEPKDEQSANLAFLTKYGNGWNRWRGEQCLVDAVAQEFAKLCIKAGVEQNGRGFYSLRRTFATVADAARDPVATRHILGHSAPSDDMGDVYRQTIEDDRLEAIAEHVRKWWKAADKKPRKKKAK